MFDAQLYRDKVEIEAWRQKGPIVRFRGWLEANHLIHAEEEARIEAEVAAEIAAAVAFAEAGTFGRSSTLLVSPTQKRSVERTNPMLQRQTPSEAMELVARDLLLSMENGLAMHIADRDRLRRQLGR
jgi:TPP-dependent pyruvate/acetoin dehydrogenase alpha subunit